MAHKFPFEKEVKGFSLLSASLRIAGVGTTVASVIGSYQYLLIETADQTMSAAFAGGLGLAIYAGWEFAFNAKTISRRLIATIIAVSAASISGYTVYQNNQHIAQQSLIARAKDQQSKAENQTAQTRSDYQAKRQALIAALADLRQKNKADEVRIAALADGKARAWQEANIRKDINARDEMIAEQSSKVEAIDSNLIKLTTPSIKVEPAEFSFASLLRASLFEGLTVICLLFASWSVTDKRRQKALLTAEIETATSKAQSILLMLTSRTDDLNNRIGQLAQIISDAKIINGEAVQANLELLQTISRAEQTNNQFVESTSTSNALNDKTGHLLRSVEYAANDLTVLLSQASDLKHGLSVANLDAIRSLNNLHVQISDAKNCKLEYAPTIAPTDLLHIATELQIENKNSSFTKDELFLSIKNRAIPYNDEGRLTIAHVMEKTGLGRPSVTEILKKAVTEGALNSQGYGYTYADAAQNNNIAQSNVVTLRSIS